MTTKEATRLRRSLALYLATGEQDEPTDIPIIATAHSDMLEDVCASIRRNGGTALVAVGFEDYKFGWLMFRMEQSCDTGDFHVKPAGTTTIGSLYGFLPPDTSLTFELQTEHLTADLPSERGEERSFAAV